MSPAFPKDFSEDLIIDILTPLLEYADTLKETGEHIAQGCLLHVLIADVQQRLEVCFSTACHAQGCHDERDHALYVR